MHTVFLRVPRAITLRGTRNVAGISLPRVTVSSFYSKVPFNFLQNAQTYANESRISTKIVEFRRLTFLALHHPNLPSPRNSFDRKQKYRCIPRIRVFFLVILVLCLPSPASSFVRGNKFIYTRNRLTTDQCNTIPRLKIKVSVTRNETSILLVKVQRIIPSSKVERTNFIPTLA